MAFDERFPVSLPRTMVAKPNERCGYRQAWGVVHIAREVCPSHRFAGHGIQSAVMTTKLYVLSLD